ncbi:hypothetical protein LPB72_06225 [Hydrogenophaga crassostreae]|uniref:histidine kinase n=1 Tax=Hydrogenophaga crassostreae TaxID=1763535 RepID=A0A167IIE6_9BURK|nr:response regulator [Hydrogenophaga crassostreae]AOW14199.1 hypothetical protein LPB072_16490 [Hydrogenophaga crassostreae]OAD42871.1 hypothetical protein LPB72_06225 [Hydrogenophaga crassostreae]
MFDVTRSSGIEVPHELIELRRRFVLRLPAQLNAIAESFQGLSDGRWEKVAVETLHRMVHSLTGTAGTFGLKEVSMAARQLEQHLHSLLEAPTQPIASQWAALELDMAQLKAAGLGAPPVDPLPPEIPKAAQTLSAPLIHLVCDCGEQSKQLCTALRFKGFRVELSTSPLKFQAAVSRHEAEQPSVVVLNMSGGDPGPSVPTMIHQLGLADHPTIPLIVGLSQLDLPTRVAATRAGARQSLPQPLPPEQLIDALNNLTGGTLERPWRVLLVDDEPTMLKVHEVYLRQAGMEVRTLSNPMQTLVEVENFEPDVLVIDVYMPEVNGPEIASALRESNIRPHLSIVFLSAETDMTQQLAALDLGGDDFLIKPVQPRHLVAAVTARARRARKNSIVQKRLETTLYERQREQLAYDHHAIVSIVNRDGNISYVNEMFCQVTGYSREELIGLHHSVAKPDQYPKGLLRKIGEETANNQVWHGEVCSSRKDGGTFWAETTVTPFLDEAGKLYQYVVIQTDISHIKAAESALRRQHDMQRMTSMAAARLMAAPASGTREAIETVLQSSGKLLGAERSDLFGFSEGGEFMSNLYSWVSPDCKTGGNRLQTTLIGDTPWMREQFLAHDMVVIADTGALPPEAEADRVMLESHHVFSLLVIPLHVNGRLAGFLSYGASFPNPEWTPSHLGLLKVLTEVVGSAIARRQADQALQTSQSRLDFLVSSSPVTIFTYETKPPFAVTYISPNVTQLLGHPPEAFLEHPKFWASLVHPEDKALVFEEFAKVIHLGVLRHEYRAKALDGGYKFILTEMILVKDAAGQPLEAIGYSIDISERKRIEQELFAFNLELEQRVAEQTQSVIESERISRATLDAMSARVVILEENGVILAANQAWRSFRQNESDEGTQIEGLNYLSFCDSMCETKTAAGTVIAQGIREVIAGEKQSFIHKYESHLPNEQRWFLCRVEPFPGDGSVRVVVSHEDITQMKLIERQQMRSQRLESLGTLAGGVAHDLNNALAPILMGMGILKDQYPEEDKLINMIHSSAKRGADMVRQLLTFAKGADGQRVVLQPALLMHELENLMTGSFPKNISIEVNIEPGLPSIVGDATQLHQILLNLSVNARDAMTNGGVLTMVAKTVEIDEIYARSVIDSKPGKYVCLRVSDNGEGIPAHILDHIFDPFFTTKAQDKGTGLGLSTVLGIVKGHGGFVQVHSTPGKGTTFAVYLPVSPSQLVTEEVPLAAQMFKGQGECILFVDDEQALREVGQTVLERLNFNPIVARDGVDGLIKATENRAILKAIITDIHMPNMDGLAFVQAVRRTLPDIPIILASGRVDESVGKEFRALGVTARLDKPFTELQLADTLRPLLQPIVA